MIDGSTPRVANEVIRARGSIPRVLAFSEDIKTTVAAPSLIPEAFPAVTVPSLLNAGRRLPSVSRFVPCFGYSSSSTIVSPRRDLTVTGTISSLNLPSFCAVSALLCEDRAKASCASRVICH